MANVGAFRGGSKNMMGLPRKRAGILGPHERPKHSKDTLRRLWRYLSHQKTHLFITFLSVLAGTIFTLMGPFLIGLAIDTMVKGRGHVNFNRLAVIVLALLATYVLTALASWIQMYLMAGVTQRTLKELRKDLFGKMQTLSLRFFDRETHGDLMSRLTNDVETINTTLSQSTTQFFSSIITVVGSLVMMFYLSPWLTVLSLMAIPMGVFLTAKVAKHSRNYFSAQQMELGALNGLIEETISGQRVVKAFGQEEKSFEDFNNINNRLKKVAIRAQTLSGLVMPIMNMINNLSFALVAFAGGWMAVKGAITIGVIASFLNYSRQFARPINDIANQFNLIQSAIAGAERVFEIMDQEPEIKDIPNPMVLDRVAGKVEFKNVFFSYKKDISVLKNINLTAKPGETIALVGPTGAGKTTIVNLLTRFYDVDQGAIYIDGKDIRKVQKDTLRANLGIVLQDSYLFSDTVKENIRYGRLDATDQEVMKAARLANAEPFILRLPDGYETVLTDEGGNLSQGQRQLLTITRAILANPSILILDEATSSVDTRTEMHIQKAMLSLMKGRTSFVIAHRLSTIRQADKILVINSGEIIEQGTHEELLSAKGFYYNLYNSQFRHQGQNGAGYQVEKENGNEQTN